MIIKIILKSYCYDAIFLIFFLLCSVKRIGEEGVRMKKKWVKAAVLGAVLVTSANAYAAEAETAEHETVKKETAESLDEYVIDETIVTATRSEKRDVDIPAATDVITAEDIKAKGAKNAAEALLPVFQAFRPTDFVTGGNICLAWQRFGGPLEDLCRNLGIRHHLACGTSLPTINGLKQLAVP